VKKNSSFIESQIVGGHGIMTYVQKQNFSGKGKNEKLVVSNTILRFPQKRRSLQKTL